jgi:threonylcarbamoyladenosine tRNA methylthiotransferase MtaB
VTRSFRIITLGCKVNQYESAYLAEKLARAGLSRANPGEKAHLTIINTCVVTGSAASQSRQAIRKAVRENPDTFIAATGCYAQGFPEELSDIKGLYLIWGNTDKKELAEQLLEKNKIPENFLHVKTFDEETSFEHLPVTGFSDRTRAFLKIQDGCGSYCSYCIVPFTRGPLRSLSPSDVLDSVKKLAEKDFKEIVLTGIHLGKYGAGLEEGQNLKSLLRSIGRMAYPLRIRLSSLEPNEIDTELIEIMAAEEWLCNHFHIPLQSGDDNILNRMNRHYSTGDFSELLWRIHKRIPLAAIGVDIMSGFPGETRESHEESCSLIRELPVSYLHVFPFSPRVGTAAADFKDRVEPEKIKERTSELREIGQMKRQEFYRQCLGKAFQVLPEGHHKLQDGFLRGMTDNYIPVVFQSTHGRINQFTEISLLKVKDGYMLGSPSPDNG